MSKKSSLSAREQFLGTKEPEAKCSLDERFTQWRVNVPPRLPRPRSNSYGSILLKMPTENFLQVRELGVYVKPTEKHTIQNRTHQHQTGFLALNETQYNMSHLSRGKVAIFSHKLFDDNDQRDGAEIDLKNLKQALPRLGYQRRDILIYNDYTLAQILETIKTLQNEDFTQQDSLIIFVMTHGDTNDKLLAKDTDYELEKIWKPFLGDKCKGLIGKPKIFFIVACRGKNKDEGVSVRAPSGRKNSTQTDAAVIQRNAYVLPVHADMLMVYSTIPGYYSYRESDRGTWYIDALCREINSLPAGKLVNFTDLLTSVNRRLATSYVSVNPDMPAFHEKKQCSSYVSTLTRNLYYTIN